MNDIKVKINKADKFLTKIKAKNGTEYDFKIEEKDISFSELKKNTSSKEDIKIKAKKSSDDENAWKEVPNVKVNYEEGWWKRGCYVTVDKLKIDGSDVEFDKGKLTSRLSSDIHSLTYVSYGAIGAGLVALLVVVYFFFFRKEEKEEESL